MQTKNQYDQNAQPHGIWEWYWNNGQLWYKGHYFHGERDGYWAYYDHNGQLILKRYYAK